jgi:hypothetical protein
VDSSWKRRATARGALRERAGCRPLGQEARSPEGRRCRPSRRSSGPVFIGGGTPRPRLQPGLKKVRALG